MENKVINYILFVIGGISLGHGIDLHKAIFWFPGTLIVIASAIIMVEYRK